MRRVFIDLANEGDTLAMPVKDSNGNILLAEGTKLRKATKDKLSKHGVRTIYVTTGEDLGLIQPLEGNRDEAIKAISRQPLKDILLQKANTFSKSNTRSVILNEVIEEIVSFMLNKTSLLVHFAHLRLIDNYTYEHSLDVCALSLVVGEKLRLTRTTLFNLGLGALIHDIGKTKVSLQISRNPGKLSDEEFAQIKKHPSLGFVILKELEDNIPLVCCQIALQHHERFSGSGYPRGLKENKTHKLSYVVGICDMYTAITSHRSYRKAFSPKEAMELFMGTCNSLFPTEIVKAFLDAVVAYPNGSKVKLSNGVLAKVVKQDTLSLKPIVKPINSQQGYEIRLANAETLDIVGFYE
ncbi:HD-GYP domain-containing protein [Proteinivorax hydrogeniformans]|uniref:HD-GYP domain-containing protein n=1 Tax=Proteinivorax hydrogeniformans TaxID=1826727 RepID=A0AAU8HQY9_9FIRM